MLKCWRKGNTYVFGLSQETSNAQCMDLGFEKLIISIKLVNSCQKVKSIVQMMSNEARGQMQQDRCGW